MISRIIFHSCSESLIFKLLSCLVHSTNYHTAVHKQSKLEKIRDKSWQSNNMLIYFVNLLAYRQQYTKYHNCIIYTMDMKLYTMKRKWWNCFIWHLVIASIVFVTYIPHNQDNAVCFVIGSRPITSLNRD